MAKFGLQVVEHSCDMTVRQRELTAGCRVGSMAMRAVAVAAIAELVEAGVVMLGAVEVCSSRLVP